MTVITDITDRTNIAKMQYMTSLDSTNKNLVNDVSLDGILDVTMVHSPRKKLTVTQNLPTVQEDSPFDPLQFMEADVDYKDQVGRPQNSVNLFDTVTVDASLNQEDVSSSPISFGAHAIAHQFTSSPLSPRTRGRQASVACSVSTFQPAGTTCLSPVSAFKWLPEVMSTPALCKDSEPQPRESQQLEKLSPRRLFSPFYEKRPVSMDLKDAVSRKISSIVVNLPKPVQTSETFLRANGTRASLSDSSSVSLSSSSASTAAPLRFRTRSNAIFCEQASVLRHPFRSLQPNSILTLNNALRLSPAYKASNLSSDQNMFTERRRSTRLSSLQDTKPLSTLLEVDESQLDSQIHCQDSPVLQSSLEFSGDSKVPIAVPKRTNAYWTKRSDTHKGLRMTKIRSYNRSNGATIAVSKLNSAVSNGVASEKGSELSKLSDFTMVGHLQQSEQTASRTPILLLTADSMFSSNSALSANRNRLKVMGRAQKENKTSQIIKGKEHAGSPRKSSILGKTERSVENRTKDMQASLARSAMQFRPEIPTTFGLKTY